MSADPVTMQIQACVERIGGMREALGREEARLAFLCGLLGKGTSDLEVAHALESWEGTTRAGVMMVPQESKPGGGLESEVPVCPLPASPSSSAPHVAPAQVPKQDNQPPGSARKPYKRAPPDVCAACWRKENGLPRGSSKHKTGCPMEVTRKPRKAPAPQEHREDAPAAADAPEAEAPTEGGGGNGASGGGS